MYPSSYLLAPKMEASRTAITAYEIAAFPTRVARIMVVTFTRPLIVWMLRFLWLLHVQIFIRRFYQRPYKLKTIPKSS